MAQITISEPALTTLAKRMVFGDFSYSGTPSGVSAPLLANPGTSAFMGVIYLMQGERPTDVTTLTTIEARANDVLAYWRSDNDALQNAIQFNRNQVIFSLPYATAIADGTATWFWIAVRNKLANSTDTPLMPSPVYNSVVGYVGTLGSGEDLEMVDVNVVKDQVYRIANLRITFPTMLEY